MASGAQPLLDAAWLRDATFGVNNAAVPAGVGTTVIKAGGPGMLCRVIITTAGTTGNCTLYDSPSGASGNVIAVIPGASNVAAAVASYVIDIRMPIVFGIAAVGAANSPAFTVSYL